MVAGARVLDLFCGTGAMGLEALSRGAAEAACWWTTGGWRSGSRGRTSRLARREGRARLLGRGRDAAAAATPRRRSTLVLLDPPYGRGLGSGRSCGAGGRLARARGDGALGGGGADGAAAGFALADRRRYGASHLTRLTAPRAAAAAPRSR